MHQMPCPDCGSPVRPDAEQLCPTCGYPLMFLRQSASDDARSVPRSPNEREDATGLTSMAPRSATDTRQFPTATYGRPPGTAGQAQCPACGYPNEAPRIRCERCGYELRAARPRAVVLGPPVPAEPPRRFGQWWLIVLIVLAFLSLLAMVITLFWTS
jgi:predicted amidophosphoribosyltransferase